MKLATAFILLMTFGNIYSQTSIFIDLNSSIKGSFGKTDFIHWKEGGNNISEDFDISMSKLSFYNPLRLGATCGVKFNNNEIGLSFSDDGSAVVSRVSFSNYQPNYNFIIPGTITYKTSPFIKSFQLTYGRYLKKLPHLKFFGGINYFFRAGPKATIKLSEMGFGGYVDDINHPIETSSSFFTFDLNHSFGLNIGFGYKIDIKKRYICDFSFNFKWDRGYLYFNQIKVVTNVGNPDQMTYLFNHYPTNSSINFTFSRRFKYTFKKE